LNVIFFFKFLVCPFTLDKEVRAIFIRTLAHLLQGYRHCLTLLRIHPKPVTTFKKAAFLGHRGLVGCNFTTRLLNSIFFNNFVAERGSPWRICDVWDVVYGTLADQLKAEVNDSRLVLTHVRQLAGQLANNEAPFQQPFIPRVIQPTEGSFSRIHQPVFPRLSNKLVQQRIDQGLTNGNASLVQAASAKSSSSPSSVPMGPPLSGLQDLSYLFTNSARSIEELRNCINCIFDNKLPEAHKSYSAVLQSLTTKDVRLALCTELGKHVAGSRAILDPAQFDIIVRLMNCALQYSSVLDEYGVAAALLPLATSFCRKLCTGVVQFAYTCIQNHPVWQRFGFK
jgi:myotubularin-related protein 5/13